MNFAQGQHASIGRAVPLPMNLRRAARFWTAPVRWRFDNGRELMEWRNLAPAVSNLGRETATGLAQSKTLARGREFVGREKATRTTRAGSVQFSSP